MKYLLDINLLLAGIWKNHSQHAKAFNWLAGKALVLSPLSELGFIHVSTNPKAINAPMDKTRELLRQFQKERQTEHIPDDLPALASSAKTSPQVTDYYLAALADRHGLRLATLDEGIKHPAAEVVN